jgi:ATP-dependent Clp protease protease subunit
MKYLFISILILILSCATAPPTQTPQEIIIKVKAVEATRLTVEDGRKGKVTQSMEVPNPEGKLTHLSFICSKTKKAFIKIFSGLSVSDVTNLWNDLCYLENNTEIRDVNLFINSPGGDAFSGLALADQIERAQARGFNITAHASGIVASAAVPVFAVCKLRLAAPGTIFMVHEAAMWKWPGRETASDIRSQNDLMDLLRDRYFDKILSNTKLLRTDLEEMEKVTTWFNADKAKDWGLVDRIE